MKPKSKMTQDKAYGAAHEVTCTVSLSKNGGDFNV